MKEVREKEQERGGCGGGDLKNSFYGHQIIASEQKIDGQMIDKRESYLIC